MRRLLLVLAVALVMAAAAAPPALAVPNWCFQDGPDFINCPLTASSKKICEQISGSTCFTLTSTSPQGGGKGLVK
jgi:hypothetical protein